MTLRKRAVAFAALTVGTALALSGCSGSSGGDNTGSKRETVTISGAFTGAQSTAFQSDLTAWGKTQGLTIKYSGSNNFQTGIVTEVKGGQAPDVAISRSPVC